MHKPNDKDAERWDVELRLEQGRVEIKSIRYDNIRVVRSSDSKAWSLEEKVFLEEKERRDKDVKRWQEEDERQKRLQEKSRSNIAGDFPDMDASEQLEAEMSSLPLDAKAMALIRRLPAREALDILSQAGIASVGGNLSSYVKIKIRQRLGDPDSDDDDEARRRSEQAVSAARDIAAKVEARAKAQARAEAVAREAAAREAEKRRAEEANRYDPEAPADVESDSDSDEDFDLLAEEKDAMPPKGYFKEAPTDEEADNFARLKNDAILCNEDGDLAQALAKYNQVFMGGGASALNLAKRAELLLKLKRPNAATRDCTAAIKLNPNLDKAFRIRGITHRKLGRWAEAYDDLDQAQRMDYDEGTAAVLQFVKGKAARAKRNAPKRARTR